MGLNETQYALIDMWDIKKTLPDAIKNLPAAIDRKDITIGQCVDDVLLFLEQLETIYQEKTL
jgi:hypothetical protein